MLHSLARRSLALSNSGSRPLTSLAVACANRHLLSSRRSVSDMATHNVPATPRPSASVIVINSRNEVLLVHRNPQLRSFGGMHVFPGGNFDAKQDGGLPCTAIRETFEETGLLLASSQDGSILADKELDRAREDINTQKLLFQNFLAQHQLAADTTSLMPFTQWVTPPNQPRRFHTQFYVTFLDNAPACGFSSGDKVERLPTPDGGQEVIAARFVHPSIILQECKAKQTLLMPPQFYLVTTLAAILDGNVTTPQHLQTMRTLSEGKFGRFIFNPRQLPHGSPPGWSVLTYEGDESRGGAKGRLHRSLVKFEKGGVVSEIVLQRNFDIFTEIDDQVPPVGSKL